jgi:transposase
LTDIHHQGFAPGRMSNHGEHGEEEARRRRSFTPEFKAEIVELCQRGDRSVGQVARDFDLTETAVREWVKQAWRDAGTRVDGGLTSAERQELIELRRECSRLREDVEILKRATAFFATAPGKAGSTWPPSSISPPAASSAMPWLTTCVPSWSRMLWPTPSPPGTRLPGDLPQR